MRDGMVIRNRDARLDCGAARLDFDLVNLPEPLAELFGAERADAVEAE